MAGTNGTNGQRGRVVVLDGAQVSNGAKALLDLSLPYLARITVVGVADLLLHAWNTESVEEKAKAAKNSTAKKTDDLESYCYRTPEGLLGVPGRNFHQALALAGKYMPDPRSPRKSMLDIVRAGFAPLDIVAPFEPETREWDYLDRQRAVVQRAAITRTRPAMSPGWRLTFNLLVNLPEYFPPEVVATLAAKAGAQVGLCDYRPTYGRFTVAGFAAEPLG